VDVLDHHDGRVDDHADRQGDASEGDQVETHLEEVHEDEAENDRRREGESDEHRVVPLPETEKHDNHRQECSQQGGLHDVSDRTVDVVGRVKIDLEDRILRHQPCRSALFKNVHDLLAHPPDVATVDWRGGDLDAAATTHQEDPGGKVVPDGHVSDVLETDPPVTSLGDFQTGKGVKCVRSAAVPDGE
jgi:hypothetical protein